MISEFPLFIFTLLAGLAAGTYAVGAVTTPEKEMNRPWVFPVVCIALLAVGLLGVLFHLGRPALFVNGLVNPSAGIAQEAYWSIAFGALLVAVAAVSWKKGRAPKALRIVCALAAVGLLVTMGVTYYSYESVAAWHVPCTILLFVAGGFAAGSVLCWVLGGNGDVDRLTAGLFVAFAAVVFAVECVAMRGMGSADMLLAIGAVLGAVAVALIAARKSGSNQYKWAVFAVALVAVAAARYGFYCVM